MESATLQIRLDVCDFPATKLAREAVGARWRLCVGYPDTDVGETIDVPGQGIWFVLIDRRCPINGQATQDETPEDWDVQPVATPHQQVVPANYKHAGLTPRRVCSDPFLMELHGTRHKYSPR